MEGLSFRDIRLLNLALLGCQVWRLLNSKYALCYKVLSLKYFPEGDIFHPKRVEQASVTWLSMAEVVKALKDGFSWQIGNGDCINLRADNCGLEGLNGEAVNSNILNPNKSSVKNLWIKNSRR